MSELFTRIDQNVPKRKCLEYVYRISEWRAKNENDRYVAPLGLGIRCLNEGKTTGVITCGGYDTPFVISKGWELYPSDVWDWVGAFQMIQPEDVVSHWAPNKESPYGGYDYLPALTPEAATYFLGASLDIMNSQLAEN